MGWSKRKMGSYQQPKDEATIRKIAEFLFGKADGESDNQFLDRRTDVSGREMFRALTFYRIIEEKFHSKAAGQIASILERLSISKIRLGRAEGVTAIQGQFPKVETIAIGTSELMKKQQQERGESSF